MGFLMSEIIDFPRYTHHKGDTHRYDFNFTGLLPGADIISTFNVAITPTGGLAEVTAEGETSGKHRYVTIQAPSGAVVGTEYLVRCQVATDNSRVKSLYKVIRILPEFATISIDTLTEGIGAIYRATLTQVGVQPPTASIFGTNPLSGAPVWSRVSSPPPGVYRATLVGAFLAGTRVWPQVNINPGVTDADHASGVRISDDIVEIRVYDYAGNLVDLEGTMYIDIEVPT